MASKYKLSRIFKSLTKCIISRSTTCDTKRYLNVLSKKYYSTEPPDLKIDDIPIENMRNFSIVAHVDHGKSTLADRILEMTGAIKANSGCQVLDKLQVEKERGITVKAQTASLLYVHKGTKYLLNLIDTPGHVDFSTEVYRSLAACQGVILLIDANEGVQAQTVSNFYLAFGKDLVIIPVLNKVDLKNANPERVSQQLQTLFDFEESEILRISAKLGTGVDKLLDTVVERIPAPSGNKKNPTQALIFDSWYDKYKGAVALIYLHNGIISVKDQVTSLHSGKSYEVKTINLLRPDPESAQSISAGQVGCITCNMRSVTEAHIGDTLHLKNKPVEPITKFVDIKPMVFAGIYPIDQSQNIALRSAIEKLTLNDGGVTVAIENSPALGQGWRLGFLGLLHMEVFTQRLEQEYSTDVIVTSPAVTYKAIITGAKNIEKYGEEYKFNNPLHYPNPQIVKEFYEPLVLATIITPNDYVGSIMKLCMSKRGIEQSTKEVDSNRVMMQYVLPLNEIIFDFHDTIKSISSGYASFDYEDYGYETSDIVKLEILLNGTPVEELSMMMHRSSARDKGRRLCERLVDIISRQQFLIAIQAKVGTTIVARENIKAFRKDVTAKLYGGDVTRRMKLLAAQSAGKKKMRMVGNIPLPRNMFIEALKK